MLAACSEEIQSAQTLTELNYQNYLYGGKELDRKFGINAYDFTGRYYDLTDNRFWSMDPMAEKYYSISPYAYCLNNPLRFIDIDGRAPGDLFSTVTGAAKDFGNSFNGISILKSTEYGATLYAVLDNGKICYTYTVPQPGTFKGAKRLPAPGGTATVGIIHSHGGYDEGYDNSNFSEKDKETYRKNGVDGYVSTTDGSLKQFNVETSKVNVLSTNMPSDPSDPERKNNNKPTDRSDQGSNMKKESGGWNTSLKVLSQWLKNDSYIEKWKK